MKNKKLKSLSALPFLPLTRLPDGQAREINKGFTLIELLVAISIIATLTAILLPNFMGARERGRDSQKITDLNSVKNALRMYYNENQAYPIETGAGVLTTELEAFLPGISQVDYTYYGGATGETFDLCVELDVGSGDEDVRSQINCGAMTSGMCNLGVGVTADKLFVECAR